MRRRNYRLTGVLACALVLGVLSLPSAAAQGSAEGLSQERVIELLRGSVTPKRVATLAQKNGISFCLVSDVEAKLRQAGATDELLDALRRLQQCPRLIRITSNAAGAQVYIDGKLRGTTDVQGRFELELQPGSYNVRVASAGYQEYQQRVTLAAAETPSSILATLSPLLVILRITSNPAGAQVYIDDKLQGTTDAQGRFELTQLKPGSYNVRITRSGYQEYQRKVTLAVGQTPDPIVATLSPLPVAFRVEHRHFPVGSCTGSLIFDFGKGTLEFQAGNRSHSFKSPLSQIQYGTYLIGGFWLKTSDGKKWDIESDSEMQILRLLQYGERALPAPPVARAS